MLAKVAHEEAQKRSATPKTLKKLYVLAALLIDEHRANVKASSVSSDGESSFKSKSSMLLGVYGDDDPDAGGIDDGLRGMLAGGVGTGELKFISNSKY